MIRINNIHLPLDYTSETVLNKAAKSINVDKKFLRAAQFSNGRLTPEKRTIYFFLPLLRQN